MQIMFQCSNARVEFLIKVTLINGIWFWFIMVFAFHHEGEGKFRLHEPHGDDRDEIVACIIQKRPKLIIS